ncbi:unnamed protein product, partial [Didymodactylos carnosus]
MLLERFTADLSSARRKLVVVRPPTPV